jgi:hypothetical protein
MILDNQTNYEIGDDESADIDVSTFSSGLEENGFHQQLEVLHLGQARRDLTLPTTRFPLPEKWRSADAVMACPPHPYYRTLPGAIAPLLLNPQKSFFYNKLSQSDYTPSAREVVLSNKSSGDQNIPQPKACSDQNVPEHHTATVEVLKRFNEAIVLTNTPWAILSNDKFPVVEEARKQAIEAQDCERALAGAHVGTPSVCQLPSCPSLKIDPQTQDAESVEFCLKLLYQTDGY